MKRIHFIAIGGSAMHSLALAMHQAGHKVSGSDDAIFEPSRSKLAAVGLLPEKLGWYPESITSEIDVIVLGMHAKKDNPELLAAQGLGISIQSYPEFIAAFAAQKTRVVIAGSHGKTTITAMILHALHYHDLAVDFMVGAPIPGVQQTIEISENNDFMLLEGDEYLSSPIDLRSKFLWYYPQIALISGIAWDHVNVFPTFDHYCEQFEAFIQSISEGGVLLYNEADPVLKKMVEASTHPIKKIPYQLPHYKTENGVTQIETTEGWLPLAVFGAHNLMNLAGAQWICQLMGVDLADFYEAISSFKGAANRLEFMAKGKNCFLYKDFAHAPSKVTATVKAVRQQFAQFKMVAVLELHTYSSLDSNFIDAYCESLAAADTALVFYDPEALKIKNRTPIEPERIQEAFQQPELQVFTKSALLFEALHNLDYSNTVLLMMSSGNFGGLDWELLKNRVTTTPD